MRALSKGGRFRTAARTASLADTKFASDAKTLGPEAHESTFASAKRIRKVIKRACDASAEAQEQAQQQCSFWQRVQTGTEMDLPCTEGERGRSTALEQSPKRCCWMPSATLKG